MNDFRGLKVIMHAVIDVVSTFDERSRNQFCNGLLFLLCEVYLGVFCMLTFNPV